MKSATTSSHSTRILAALIMTFSAFLLPTSSVHAAEITVTNGNDSGAGSLRQAILDASAGDTILFNNSYTITLASTPTIDKNLTIDGGANTIILSGNNSVRVMWVNEGVTVVLNHLTIQDGVGDNGGGIRNLGTLTLNNSLVTGNSASYGGGIVNSGTLTLHASTISLNSASADGAGLYNSPGATMIIESGSLIGGEGAGNTAIDGASAGGIFNYDATLIIDSSTVSHNTSANSGGGIMVHGGTVTITNSTIQGNTATNYFGGGILVSPRTGTVTLLNSTVSANTSNYSGGGIYSSGILTLTGSTVSGNSTTSYGGGLWNDGTLTIQGNSIIGGGNTAPYAGGIYNKGGLEINASVISGNNVTGDLGGGVYNDAGGTTTVTASSINANTAYSGGGFYNKGILTIQNGTIIGAAGTGNLAYYDGAGIYNDSGGMTTLDASTISHNQASFGGGIFNGGTLVVRNNSLIDSNFATYGGGIHNGGGYWNYYGTVTIDASTVSNNTAYLGGGIWNQGMLTIQSGSVIGGVDAGNTASSGGGIYNNYSSTVNITHSTVRGNWAVEGGGVINYSTLNITESAILENNATSGGGVLNRDTLTAINSTLAGNTSYFGGGLYNANGTALLHNVTLSGNSATTEGGNLYTPATVELKNTIVANSLLTSNCFGTYTDSGGNLVWGDSTCPGINANPMLGSPTENGGPTITLALQAGSAAIDAGIDALCPAVDQRGLPRPVNSHCDSGAYEYQENIPPVVESIQRADPDPTTAASVNFTVTFSENVNGVDVTDFAIASSGLTNTQVTAVNGTGTAYTVTVNTGNGEGTLRLDVSTGATIFDSLGMQFTNPYDRGESYTITKTAPLLLSPTNGEALFFNRPTFDWLDFATATGYQIQVSRNNTFTLLVSNVSLNGGTNSTYTPPSSLPPNLTLYWRVRAKMSLFTYSQWSATFSFHTANPPSIPALISPPNNALILIPYAKLDWGPSSVPVGTEFLYYEIELAEGGLFTGIPISTLPGLDNHYWQSDILSRNTGYYWRVRACNTLLECSDWSTPRSFRMSLAAPNSISPGGLAPEPATDIHMRRPTFLWESVAGATSYTVEASISTTFATKAINATAATNTYTRTSDLAANTTYYWRVKANGTNGPGPYSEVLTFLTGNPPSVPVLSSPINNALLYTTTPMLEWNNSSIPTGSSFHSYEIEIADTSTFNHIVIPLTVTGVTNSQVVAPTLLNSATYFWRVRSRSWAGEDAVGDYSAWSAVRSFRVAFAGPTLQLPTDTATGVALKPTFTWTATIGATSYVLNVSKVPTFATLALNKTVYTNSYTHTLNLTANTLYYWRVKVNGRPYGPGLWSSVFTFTTTP